MYAVVLTYLDNLIAWGDMLFLQDTIESVSQATQVYLLVENVLGPRPSHLLKKSSEQLQTYTRVYNNLKKIGPILRDMKVDVPFNLMTIPAKEIGNTDQFTTTQSSGKAPNSNVPKNKKFLSYWNIVADRLLKIRNCLDSEGRHRQVPLFEPPIDPEMLARAVAAGLDVDLIGKKKKRAI